LRGIDSRLARELADPDALWARAALERWGLCGVALSGAASDTAAQEEQDEHDGQRERVWAALVSPALQLPSRHPLARWARTPGAAHLVALEVPAGDAQQASTRHLVQGLCRHLHSQVDTIEAVGSLRRPSAVAPPVELLLEVGFAPVDEQRGPDQIRLRLDLGQVVRWRPPEVQSALRRLAGLVPHPVAPPEPTGRVSAH